MQIFSPMSGRRRPPKSNSCDKGQLEYRWNTRHVSDGERMAQFVPLIAGKRLFYKQPVN